MCLKSVCNMFKVSSKYGHNLFAKCPNYVEHLLNLGLKYVENMSKFDLKYVPKLFKICPKSGEICPNISKICPTFVHNLFPTDWEVATTSVTYHSVSSSRTDESVVSMARHCCGQQPRNPALPQPSSGCRATQST